MVNQRALEAQLLVQEKMYNRSPSADLLKELQAVRSALDCLLTVDAEKKIRYSKQRFYEHGDKPGKFLAYVAKQRAASQYIATIVDSDDNIFHDNKNINNSFRDYYINLYFSEKTGDHLKKMVDFFSEINLPTISVAQK